jgi:hypothetical protein
MVKAGFVKAVSTCTSMSVMEICAAARKNIANL